MTSEKLLYVGRAFASVKRPHMRVVSACRENNRASRTAVIASGLRFCWNDPMSPPPLVFTLLVADRVALDRSTGRCDLFGVFHALNVQLPAQLSFEVYYVLTDIRGRFALELEVLDPLEERLVGGPVVVKLDDPLSIAQGTARSIIYP